ncbi:TPA: response regulator [Yersinia enterocolitica]|nr:response regulator [Yersinia enterocolitica]HDL6638044.1 response regulator [Yersinia enterocolitica]HDL6660562.1 response regulator [Yersinia enterocolitica]HDL6664050.1 response regulator [Yersinia enterocolitica]HDL6712388.1 response regulator [Yersinia enterocolitica]
MNILLVEDNYDKLQILHKLIENFKDKVTIKKVISVNDAINELTVKNYDLMIIDIQIPDIDGGDINETGGIELLGCIENLTNGWIPRYIIGLTSHAENIEYSKKAFKEYGWEVFDTNIDKDLWSKIITSKIKSTINNSNYIEADIAIVTALEKPELEAVLENSKNWEILYLDSFEYHLAELTLSNGKTIKIIAASAEKMGSSWSSTLSTRIIMRFSPKLVIMTGICAGIEGKTSLGDIIIADPVWDWGAGKISEVNNERIFLPDPHQIPLSKKIKDRARVIIRDNSFLKDLAINWQKTKVIEIPRIIIAPMACGSSVISNQSVVDEINANNRKMLAIEMESYGVMAACSSFDIPCMIIKSVCDFGNVMKADEAQDYAAYTSAATAFEFIKKHFPDLSNN